jgi:glycosyltransferase involved in cell wall biosynthesis
MIMKFSVVTASFNGMPKLKSCIGSIREQCCEELHVEHLVQDGISKDGSAEFIQVFQQELPDCANYQFSGVSEDDSGMYDAINRAWGRSTGDILSWLNVDEQYLPGTLSEVQGVFETYPDVDVVWGNFISINADGTPRSARIEIPARYLYLRNMNNYIPSCTVFFRRHLWDSGLLRLDEAFAVSADHELYLRLIQSGIKFHHISKYLSLFEVSDGNLSVTMRAKVLEEGVQLLNMYGACKSFFAREVIKALRRFEKLARGSYSPGRISYRYILDEDMNCKEFSEQQVGTKFNFS